MKLTQKTNMGDLDKIIRVLVALAIGILSYTNVITGTTAIVLGVIGIVLVVTSLVNFCPLYQLLGVNTCKR